MYQENKHRLQTISFFVLLAGMLILVGKLFLPYASVLLWSAVIYVLVRPLYNKILSRMNKEKKTFPIKKRLLAGSFAIITVLVVAGVLFFVVIKIFGQGKILVQNIQSFLENINNSESGFSKTDIAAIVNRLSMGTVDISNLDLQKEFLNLLSSSSDKILRYATSLVKNAGSFFLSLVFFAFALYFFYVDGAYLFSLLKHAIPIDNETSDKLFSKIGEITTNLLRVLFWFRFTNALHLL